MKKSILFCLMLMAGFALQLEAQLQHHYYVYGDSLTEQINRTIETDDGGFVMAGYTTSRNLPGDRDAVIMKLDGNGVLQWTVRYGYAGADVATDVIENEDQELIVVGTTSQNNDNGFMLKIASNGTLLWERLYGISHVNQDNEKFTSVTEMKSAGGYAIGGWSEVGPNNTMDLWVVRTDANGNVLWSNLYGDDGGGNNDWARRIMEGPNDNIYVGGVTRSFTNGSHHDGFLLNIDESDGDLNWVRNLGNDQSGVSFDNGITRMLLEPNGNLIVVGEMVTNCFSNSNATNGYFMQINSNGTYSDGDLLSTPVMEFFLDVKYSPNGNLIFGGLMGNNGTCSQAVNVNLVPDLDGLLLEYDLDSMEVVFAKRIGEAGRDYVRDIFPRANGWVDAFGIASDTTSFSDGTENGVFLRTSLDTTLFCNESLPLFQSLQKSFYVDTPALDINYSPNLVSLTPSGSYLIDSMFTDTLCVPDPLVATVTTTVTSPCIATGSAVANVSGGTPPYTYLWNTGLTTMGIYGLNMNTYTVTVTDSDGNTVTASGNVQAQLYNLVVNAGPDVSGCEDGTVQLNGSTNSNNIGVISWIPTTGLSNPNILNPVVTLSSPMITYTLTVIDSNNCFATDQVVVTMNPVNHPFFAEDTVSVCLGDSIQLFPENLDPNGTCFWNPFTPTISNANDCNPWVSPTTPFTYHLTHTNSLGCVGNASIHVELDSNCCSALGLSAMFASNINGLSGTFSDLSQGSQINAIEWDFDDGTTLLQLPGSSATHSFPGNGTYNVCLSITALLPGNQCCKDSICMPITIDVDTCEYYQAAFSSIQSIGGWPQVTFTDQTTPGASYVTWDFGDNTTAVTSGANSSITHQYNCNTGCWYTVTMVSVAHIDSATCCTDTAVREIYVRRRFGIGIGNSRIGVFPNPVKEEINVEYRLPEGKEKDPVDIRIFDLSGQLQLEVKGHSSFEGKAYMGGANLPAGIYVIEVEGKDFTESMKIVKTESAGN